MPGREYELQTFHLSTFPPVDLQTHVQMAVRSMALVPESCNLSLS